jgi:flagellin
MAIGDISLTAGMRSNLLNLQDTAKLLDRTQTRLSTGKKVNTALDDPVNFFKAQSYTNRASDFAGFKDGMSDAIQTVKAADAGIKGITTLLNSAKSIVTAARSNASGTSADLETQFNTIMTQIHNLAEDSGYGGVNLLNGDTLTVAFDTTAANNLGIAGQDNATTTSVGGQAISVIAGDFTTAEIDAALTQIDSALNGLRSFSATMSSNLSIISARQDFTSNMISTLQTGADNLTLADMNEEGANMLMLQTRQSLGTTALSLSSQAAQSVLRLFG